MNKIIYIFVICLTVVSCSKKAAEVMETSTSAQGIVDQTWRNSIPEAGPARTISIGEYQSFDLANGLKVIVVENHKLPRISYQLSLKNSPILEGSKSGFVSMTGSLISAGTTKRKKAELDAAIDYIGANISAFGSGMYGTSLVKHQEKLLNIMTEMLYMPSFPSEEFGKLKKQTLSNLSQAKSSPDAIAGNVASVLNYGKDHPYGEISTEKTIDNIEIEDCKNYFNQYFKPNNAYLIIVGDISIANAKKTAENYFGAWKGGTIPTQNIVKPTFPNKTNVSFADKAGAVQSVIRVTHPINLKPGDADVLKTRVVNTILGGGMFAGRLMQNLREDKAYTYNARSSISSDELIGNFNAYASVRNEVTDSSIIEFLHELKKINDEPVSEDDMKLAKSSIAGSFARSLESPQTIAGFALTTFKYNLPKDYYNTYLNKLDAITISEVQATARKYVRPDQAHILVVGNKDEVAEKLLPFDADGKIDFYGPYGDVVKYDEIAMDGDVTVENIISDYIEAVGGKAKLESINTMKTEMEMSLMGQTATIEMNQKKPGMFHMAINMQGMTVQEQKFDGTTAVASGMGQKQQFTKGPEFEAMKEQAKMFPHLNYDLSTLELKGIEDVDGTKAYKIIKTSPDGTKSTEFFSIENSLLIRTIGTQKGQGGQEISVTNDFADYKEIGGVMVPYKLTVSGAMPQPMVMNVKNITVNGPIADSTFK